MKIGIQHFDKVTIMGRRTIEKLVLYWGWGGEECFLKQKVLSNIPPEKAKPLL